MEVFESLDIVYYNTENQDTFDTYSPTNMIEMKMMIKTRPRYPSNKLTFTIANIAKGKNIFFLNINLNSTAKFGIDLSLEDSKRNILNSFVSFFVF